MAEGALHSEPARDRHARVAAAQEEQRAARVDEAGEVHGLAADHARDLAGDLARALPSRRPRLAIGDHRGLGAVDHEVGMRPPGKMSTPRSILGSTAMSTTPKMPPAEIPR